MFCRKYTLKTRIMINLLVERVIFKRGYEVMIKEMYLEDIEKLVKEMNVADLKRMLGFATGLTDVRKKMIAKTNAAEEQ